MLGMLRARRWEAFELVLQALLVVCCQGYQIFAVSDDLSGRIYLPSPYLMEFRSSGEEDGVATVGRCRGLVVVVEMGR